MPPIEHPNDLHPELKAVLVAHKDATAALKRASHDDLVTLLKTAARIEQHLHTLEQAIVEAELAGHDHALDSKMEWLHAPVHETRNVVRLFRDTGRTLGLKLTELEQKFDAYEQRVALAGPGFAPSAVGASGDDETVQQS